MILKNGGKFKVESLTARWSYENLLPYFKKAEGMFSSRYVSDKANHNRVGPLKVRDSVFLTPLAAIYKVSI